MANYAHPDVLVSTDWVAERLDDTDNIRLIEANEDVLLYETGHIRNAVKIDWVQDLQDDTVRDFIGPDQFAELAASKGISNDTTVVFYGDRNNWWACYAFWVFKLYGHENAVIMDGGRKKWVDEGRKLTKEKPDIDRADYTAPDGPNESIRAFRDGVLEHQKKQGQMVDVRSPEEFRGEVTHLPDLPEESSMRGGHIPGSRNVPWSTAVNDDGTFKSVDELQEIYERGEGLDRSSETVAYCRIGERSSHTWFVLTYLLGFDNVSNYDGSWTEWGNLVGMPIERGDAKPVEA